jgi:hypothetical protein
LHTGNGAIRQDALDKFGKDKLAFPRNDRVNEGELTDHFGPHHPFTVGTAKHNERFWGSLFDALGQGERGHVLLVEAGEADDFRALAERRLDAFIEKAFHFAARPRIVSKIRGEMKDTTERRSKL